MQLSSLFTPSRALTACTLAALAVPALAQDRTTEQGEAQITGMLILCLSSVRPHAAFRPHPRVHRVLLRTGCHRRPGWQIPRHLAECNHPTHRLGRAGAMGKDRAQRPDEHPAQGYSRGLYHWRHVQCSDRPGLL